MSSSSAPVPSPRVKLLSGRVIMGVGSPGPDETTIQQLEGKKDLSWNTATSEEYIGRVRAKAQAMARDIISQAMAEAERLKEQARQEGLEQGLAEGQQQVDEFVAQLGQTATGVFDSVQRQGLNVWESRRGDFVTLIKLVVERTLACEMDQRRAEILESLLDESLERIELGRTLTVRVAPQDHELAETLLQSAQAANPGLARWKIRPDASVDPGGVILETDEGRVDNTLAARWTGVDDVLQRLTVLSLEHDAQNGAGGDAPQG